MRALLLTLLAGCGPTDDVVGTWTGTCSMSSPGWPDGADLSLDITRDVASSVTGTGKLLEFSWDTAEERGNWSGEVEGTHLADQVTLELDIVFNGRETVDLGAGHDCHKYVVHIVNKPEDHDEVKTAIGCMSKQKQWDRKWGKDVVGWQVPEDTSGTKTNKIKYRPVRIVKEHPEASEEEEEEYLEEFLPKYIDIVIRRGSANAAAFLR